MKRDLECLPHSQAAGCNAFWLRSSNMLNYTSAQRLQTVIGILWFCVCVCAACVSIRISSLTQERTSMAAQRTPVTAIRHTCTWQLEVIWKRFWKPFEKAWNLLWLWWHVSSCMTYICLMSSLTSRSQYTSSQDSQHQPQSARFDGPTWPIWSLSKVNVTRFAGAASADSVLLVILGASCRPDHSAECHTEEYSVEISEQEDAKESFNTCSGR